MEDASPSSTGTVAFKITGWTNSKASDNSDGGVASLIEFLEKKASQPKRAPLKIIESAREFDSLLISVRATGAPRFAHLNGFTFAGVKLVVTEINQGPQSSQTTSLPPSSQPPRGPRPSQPIPASSNGFSTTTPQQIPQEATKVSTSIPIQAARFRDEADIGANFVTSFFPLFDIDRRLALQNFYDSSSTFSLSVNTHANRLETPEKLDSSWSAYIKKSRNLTRITHPPARMSRLHRGQEHIFKEWSTLPTTRHPPFDRNNSNNWLIECHSLPGLPDPTGAAPGGVGGLIVMVHGSFEELDGISGQVTSRRSFDRTFIIGPGGGLGGIRVVSDIISLRAYGGSEGLAAGLTREPGPETQKPQEPIPQEPQVQQQPQIPPHPEIQPGTPFEGFALPLPGKGDDQLAKETTALELSFRTKLRLLAAGQLLEASGWDVAKAFASYETMAAKGEIPMEALLQV